MIDITKFDGHTPGPYYVEHLRIYASDTRDVADVRGWGWLRYRNDGASQMDANARLFAAAPDLLAEVIRLRAEVAALTADAGRYRWLRAQHWSTSPMCVVSRPEKSVRFGCDCPSGHLLDGAIDSELKGGAA